MNESIMAITIHQPWAGLIAEGVKRVENRNWKTEYRGLLGIHAGKSRKNYEFCQDRCDRYPLPCLGIPVSDERSEDEETFGAIVAVARLVDCVSAFHISVLHHPYAHGPWCWVLQDVKKLQNPIICSGKQKLWRPDAVIVKSVLVEMEQST